MPDKKTYKVLPLKSSQSGWHTRGYLPHLEKQHLLQSVTFRLHDAVPQKYLLRLEQKLLNMEEEKAEIIRRQKIEEMMDKGRGACHLRNPQVARIVEDALLALDPMRYRLIAWAIMPNHVHLQLALSPGTLLGATIRSIKNYSARRANLLLGQSGTFWFPDYYDRYIRDPRHFYACLNYIERNPCKVGLCRSPSDWPFSSARRRADPPEDGGIIFPTMEDLVADCHERLRKE